MFSSPDQFQEDTT